MNFVSFLACASLLFFSSLIKAESPIPQYVCSSNETEQNGTLIRINKAYEHIVYPTNCYYTLPSDGIQDGIHYYEFIFVEGNSFVGFTTKDHFADGFHIRGLFYGGTLSDGLASLGAFSRRTHQGDTVGLRIDLTKEKIKIYVHLNGRSLGLAFDVNRGNISALYPTVHTYDDALIRIRKLETFPTETEYQPKVFSGIEGDFAFEQAVDNGKNVSTDGWKQFVLSLRKKPKLSNDTFQVYRLHFAVINSINGFLIKNQNSKYEVKGVESTLIGTYGEALKAEAFVFKLISGLEDVVTNGDNLLIKSKSNTQLNLKRFTKPAPTAVTLNPILGEYNFG